jgi:hypothetical protein
VKYGGGTDTHLFFHVDASDITLNLCLDRDFEESELYFEGRRCEQYRQGTTQPQERFFIHTN